MPSVPDDSRLDALLRDVAVPEHLAARLKGLTVPSDGELDEMLGGLTVPENLALRLQAIPDDELLDTELHEVVAPLTLRGQVLLPEPVDVRRAWRRWAVQASAAAALFLAITATLFSAAGAYLTSIFPPRFEPQWVVLEAAPAVWDAELVATPDSIDTSTNTLPVMESVAMSVDLAGSEPQLDSSLDETFSVSLQNSPVAQYQALVARGMRPWDDVVLLQWNLLGAPQYSEDELPDLVRVQLQPRSGLELPPVRGYDRRFLLREGIFPPITPAAHVQLKQLDIPLNTSTSSLELTQAALEVGKLPNEDEVRVEHFLASLAPRFPAAPRGQLALYVQGGPSPFGPSEARLLQLGVQAGKLRRQAKTPTHLVVAVDLSASMARGGRLDMVRSALEQMHGQLSERDALSLVAFEESVVARIEHLAADQGEVLHEQLRQLAPRGGTNLAAGLQAATSLVLTQPEAMGDANFRKRLVLITDSRAAMPDDTTEKIVQLMALADAEGVEFDVFDVSGRSDPDPLLERLALELGGTCRAVHSRQRLFASLVESLAGQEPAVALEIKLQIRFNPEVVAAYRLMGHEPNLLAQVLPPSTDAQLLPEEAATSLLEVWFTGHSSPNIGNVIVSWKDPQSGKRQQKQVPLTRELFADSWESTPVSFQTAAVAAEFAEQVRASREALRQENLIPTQGRNNVATIRRVIRPWSLTLREEPDVQRLLSLLDRFEKVRGR
jgi:Mg-chelatase subunit ChlD